MYWKLFLFEWLSDSRLYLDKNTNKNNKNVALADNVWYIHRLIRYSPV